MRHAREDYNRIQDPAGLIPEDEPVFLLRGQDVFAPDTLRYWAKELREIGGSKDIPMAMLVEEWADTMQNWQNTVKVKIPDLTVGL